jgi:hypothetical protein
MKLSDKALRQIGRKLLDHTATHPHQDDASNTGKTPVTPSGSLRQRVRKRARTASVLPLTKRLRSY